MRYYNNIKYTFASILFFSLLYFPLVFAQTDSTYLTSYITLVKDIRLGGNGSYPHKITNVNGMAYFLAKEPSSYGIWKSDGTEEGTQFVADLDLSDISLNYSEFTSFNNQLFFKAADTQVGYGSELWATDGTEEGTRLVKDIYEGGSSSSPSFLTVKDNVLLFLASSEDLVAGGTETELWRTDGTTEGTYMVKDIWPGPYHGHGGPGINGYTSSAVVNDIYYFSALGVGEYQGDNYIGGLELWRSDGTEMGTYLVTDLTPFREAVYGVHWSYTHNLTNFNNKLVFSSYATEKGNELFISDGTAIGTTL